jgi:hypothetical protein
LPFLQNEAKFSNHFKSPRHPFALIPCSAQLASLFASCFTQKIPCSRPVGNFSRKPLDFPADYAPDDACEMPLARFPRIFPCSQGIAATISLYANPLARA